jgi:pilus assembly protein CpaB
MALLVLALGCGLVASVGITQVIDRRNHTEQTTETETVFVTVNSVAMGEPLNATMVRAEEWPKNKVPQGAVTKLEELEGRRCVTRLMAGEPIFRAKLTDKLMGVSPSIPKGFRLMTVKVDAVSGSASMILPGDRVDVLCHLRAGGSANPEPITRTILQYVKVFAVDSTVSLEGVDGDGKSIPAKTVTLLVTPDQAQRVALATELGSVRLVLRPIDDTEQVTVESTTPSELLGMAKPNDKTALPATEPAAEPKGNPEQSLTDMMKSLANRAKEEKKEPVLIAQADPPTPPKPAPQRHVMRLLLGTKFSEVVMEAEADQAGSLTTKKYWRTSGGDAASTQTSDPPAAMPPKSDVAEPSRSDTTTNENSFGSPGERNGDSSPNAPVTN